MDCSDIRDTFVRGDLPQGPAVDEHLRFCPHCAELFKNAAALGRRLALGRSQAVPDVGSLLSVVEHDLAHEAGLRGQLRGLPTWQRIVLGLVTAAALATFGALRALRPDLYEYPVAVMAGVVLLYAFGVGMAIWATLRPLIRPFISATQLGVTLGAALVPIFAVLTNVHLHAPLQNVPTAITCFRYGSLLAAPLLLLLWAMDRAEHVKVSTALLSAGSMGLTANIILQLHCPSPDPLHLLLGHAAIGLFWMLLYGGAVWLREQRAR